MNYIPIVYISWNFERCSIREVCGDNSIRRGSEPIVIVTVVDELDILKRIGDTINPMGINR